MSDRLKVATIKAVVTEINNINMDVSVHQSIDSTNSWSLQQCKSGKALPFACFAEEQTHGRGRRGKQWLTPPHSNIAMSVAWPFVVSHQQLHLLPLSIALSIVRTLEDIKLEQVQIKWPNDVYVRDKKIAGILIETQPLKNRVDGRLHVAVVVGIGLNYDMSSMSKTEVQGLQDFTDIIEESKFQSIEQVADRTKVASTLLRYVTDVCRAFPIDPDQYLDEYRAQYDYCKGKNVELVLDDKQVLSGVALGVNDEAELIVMVEGEKRLFNSAEVSVRASGKPVST